MAFVGGPDMKTRLVINALFLFMFFAVLGLWQKDARQLSFLQGQESVYASMKNGDEHACGPYEQPVHKNFQKDTLKKAHK